MKKRLAKADFKSISSLASRDPKELSEVARIDLKTATSICSAANTILSTKQSQQQRTYSSAAELGIKQELVQRISTGSKNLDDLFWGNGIETGVVTQFYGEAGSGKTQVCHTLCAMLPLHYMGIYVDTEGTFSARRLESIAKSRGLDYEKILKNILVSRPFNSTMQELYIEQACSDISSKIKLIIIDSMTSHYRGDYPERSDLPQRQQSLSKYMHMLNRIAQQNQIAVVVTNQIHTNPSQYSSRNFVAIGGNVMAHGSKHRVQLRRLHQTIVAELDISYCYPQNIADFIINEKGVTDSEDVTKILPYEE